MIVKSNGVITYVGKDISLPPLEVRASPQGVLLPEARRTTLITTSSQQEDDPVHPIFGAAGRVYNVIDQRQSYLQNIVRKALAQLGHPEAADLNSVVEAC